MLLIVAPVLQPLITGTKAWSIPTPVIGESEFIRRCDYVRNYRNRW
jgi:hypothetical protein